LVSSVRTTARSCLIVAEPGLERGEHPGGGQAGSADQEHPVEALLVGPLPAGGRGGRVGAGSAGLLTGTRASRLLPAGARRSEVSGQRLVDVGVGGSAIAVASVEDGSKVSIRPAVDNRTNPVARANKPSVRARPPPGTAFHRSMVVRGGRLRVQLAAAVVIGSSSSAHSGQLSGDRTNTIVTLPGARLVYNTHKHRHR
jgi:hypothetical protein